MVKFGRHLQFFLENEHKGSDLYVVPYNDVRALIGSSSEDEFTAKWRECLNAASADFHGATHTLWQRVFAAISTHPEARGALPEVALRTYMTCATVEEAEELLSLVRAIHSTALTNAEALRKLVKKFDKDVEGHQQQRGEGDSQGKLSPTLLPEVYAANFTVGQPTLEAGMALLRTHLHLDEDDEEAAAAEEYHPESGAENDDELKEFEDDDYNLICGEATPSSYLGGVKGLGGTKQVMDLHLETVERRKVELEWLRSMVQSIAPAEISHIVAHRGFHSPQDRSDRRPLENSLSAYEAAWTNGVHLCECDVALTKDEKLVLAHDEDFSRLALDPSSPESNVKVQDLTLRQLMSLPLKSGSRPPLLIDVLRSARAIGGGSQLIVEIKPGNAEAGTALARLFYRHPELMECCAVVMSFDAFAIHNLRKEMAMVLEQHRRIASGVIPGGGGGSQMAGCVSLPTAMSLGNFGGLHHPAPAIVDSSSPSRNVHPTVTGNSPGGYELGYGHDSTDHFGVGLSVSFHRKDSFNFSPFNSHAAATTATTTSGTPGKVTGTPPPRASRASIEDVPPLVPDSANSPATMSSRRRQQPGGAPKLMLLTVADKPQKPCELWVDVSDLSPVDGWLDATDGSLDGVYLQFQREMLQPDGAAALRALADRHEVGVWGHNGRDPDDWDTFHWLVREGRVSYVNSDLPKTFKRGVFRKAVSSFGT